MSVVCVGCSGTFNKPISEVKRQAKHFCTRSCQAKNANNGKGNLNNLVTGSKQDEFSPFRYYLWKTRSRHVKKGFEPTDLTLEYLRDLWVEQQGKCCLTGWSLRLPVSLTEWEETRVTKETASLDRIRPHEPYMKGNVRFIAHMANMAKHVYTDEEVISFCQAVTNTQNK